ncbi:ROK family transcriptional regulator [Agromyces atrinae]|uniref:Putative NBD/HSP70 family sugar kinase n=1 Tax=Agromyces atrinae TaxID=592376 RepID=A0A852S8T2_9MICO|nr:ROK family transcriptional regulator [Agromyces atrinae]NYD68616.1 putative NBD/HSP70 family sugar kinase [Agromyces atrinae]
MSDLVSADGSRKIAREVLIHGPISRAELGLRLGLSAASLTRLSKPLIESGLLVERQSAEAVGVGRPTKPLDVVADAGRFVGIKLTGDDATAVLTDVRAAHSAVEVVEVVDRSPGAVIALLADLVERVSGGTELTGIGVSIGGNVLDGRTVTRAPFLGWRDVELGALLEERAGAPVTVANDVVALTVAEKWFGAARGRSSFAVITIGAGVGYGLVSRGTVVVTPDTGLGLGGHFPLDPHGPVCIDGHRGCATALLSIPSICDQVESALGRPVRYDEVLDLAESGEPAASLVVDAAARALGHLIAAVVNLAMLDAVVLAGEGLELVRRTRSRVLEVLSEDRDPEALAVDVFLDDSGFTAWARGAAAVAIEAGIDALGDDRAWRLRSPSAQR